MYADDCSLDLHCTIFELEENVKNFIEAKVNDGTYRVCDFRVFFGEELYVEKAPAKRTEVTLRLKYRGMS
jgi:hypothetical protein